MTKNKLYGAILGDLAGQPYEFKYKGDYSEFNIHNPDSYITDDTIMILATADALLRGNDVILFEWFYRHFGTSYDSKFFGKGFREWLKTPYGTTNDSYGNGCLMRLSPIMYVKEQPLKEALVVQSCLNSHQHADSIVSSLRLYHLYRLSNERGLRKSFNPIKPFERFQVEAKNTIEFIENAYWYLPSSTHQSIEQVVKCGGDTDTNASIIGELMNYTYDDLTKKDIDYVESKLDSYLLDILREFNKTYE